jgi:hypothetical protein
VRKGFGTGAQRWYIHHEGGGWCQMETPYQSWPNDNCLARSTTRLGTLSQDPESAVWDETVNVPYGSANRGVNPLMWNWNSVYLRYCDGGTFTGDAARIINATTTLHFRGRAIREATVRSLARHNGAEFTMGTDFVIGGSSAGGLAVYLHTDWWQSQLDFAAPAVVGLADSGFFVDWSATHPTQATHSFDADLRSGFALFNSSGGVNAACIAAHPGNKSDCIFAANTLPHIRTPIFVLQSAFDSWQLQWEHGEGRTPDYAALNGYGDTLTRQLRAASSGENRDTIGGFVEHCCASPASAVSLLPPTDRSCVCLPVADHHCSTKTLWTEAPRLGPQKLTQAAAFTHWYTSIASAQQRDDRWPLPTPVGILWQTGALPCRECGCPNATLCPDYPNCTKR